MRMINEPTAAAMACGFHESDEPLNVLIFDLGGGTFDVSIACISDGVVDVQSTFGDMMLGGRDLDEVLVNHCIDEFRTATGVDLTENIAQRARLTTVCEAAKLELCEQNEVTVRLDLVEGHDLNIQLTRIEFE